METKCFVLKLRKNEFNQLKKNLNAFICFENFPEAEMLELFLFKRCFVAKQA